MTSIASNFFGKMSWGPRSRLRAASSGISAPSAGPAGPGGPSGGPFVTFRVTAKGMQADETLYMVGDHDDLGAGNPLLGKRLSCKDGKTWTIRRPLKRGMSTYRFVSVSKGTENGDSYARWENHDNRVFKRHGPLTTCVEVLEITGFGERQRVTPPVIQPCKQEMEESLGPEPEPCQEQAKIAGTFDVFPVQDTPVSASPESTALSMRMSLLEEQLAKIVEEKVSEKLTIQEGYRRFEIDRLEQDNQALREELKDLKALRALDDRSDARSEISAGWELAEQEREEGASSSLPALEDGPSS